jgi:hypothetical protein
MFWRSSERYIVLQDHVPVAEQQAIARAVVYVMPSEGPSESFVTQLSRDLIAEARRLHTVRLRNSSQTLRMFGFLSGGVASVVGGILIWLLVSHNHHGEGLTDVRGLGKSARSDLSLSGA